METKVNVKSEKVETAPVVKKKKYVKPELKAYEVKQASFIATSGKTPTEQINALMCTKCASNTSGYKSQHYTWRYCTTSGTVTVNVSATETETYSVEAGYYYLVYDPENYTNSSYGVNLINLNSKTNSIVVSSTDPDDADCKSTPTPNASCGN